MALMRKIYGMIYLLYNTLNFDFDEICFKLNSNPGNSIIIYNSGFRPDLNEVFLLKQPIPGFYEFRPFENFYRVTGRYNYFKRLFYLFFAFQLINLIFL
jgi:hypothetical protein